MLDIHMHFCGFSFNIFLSTWGVIFFSPGTISVVNTIVFVGSVVSINTRWVTYGIESCDLLLRKKGKREGVGERVRRRERNEGCSYWGELNSEFPLINM